MFARIPGCCTVRTDNGLEFTSRAFIGWAQGHGIRHILIGPGRPMQNGYIESFNGRFRGCVCQVVQIGDQGLRLRLVRRRSSSLPSFAP
jgi:transposase InsO family protein